MSKRNALFVALVAAVVLAALFLWPEPARADFAVSARIGSGFGGHHVGSRLHHGDGGLRGRLHLGKGGLHGRLHLGHRDFRHRSFHDDRRRGKHGLLLGDRFRLDQHRRIGGGRHAKGALIGDRFRFEQQRRLDEEFLGRDRKRDRLGHKRHRDKRFGHRRGRHDGKWLHAAPLLLPYGGADVIVREIIVPVPVPVPAAGRPDAAAERSAALDPRGRATLVGEEDGIVGDWGPGDVLPDGVPHVTLDHVSYGLPEPAPGQKYARVGNDVLRIDAGTRRIVEVVAR